MFRLSTGALHTTALPYSSNPKDGAQLPKPSRSKTDLTLFDDTPLSLDTATSIPSSSDNNVPDKPRRSITITNTNMFPSFLDNPSSTSTSTSTPNPSNHTPTSSTGSSIPRSQPQQPQQQINGGGGGGMNGATNGIGGAAGGSNGIGAGMGPMNAGQQMDVSFLWQKVLELSEVLRENRERTRGVVEGAEELAVSVSSLHTVTG